MEEERKTGVARIVTLLMETFGLSHGTALAAAILILGVGLFGVFWVVHASPPRTLVITAGAPGSSFETNALKYRLILARSGVDLKILASEGSLENLKRLQDPSTHVDVGFVQGGMSNEASHRKLFSLGSVSYQPLLGFHRGTNQLR